MEKTISARAKWAEHLHTLRLQGYTVRVVHRNEFVACMVLSKNGNSVKQQLIPLYVADMVTAGY